MTIFPWPTFDPDERADAESVAALEDAAETAEPVDAMLLLGEADALRAKWDRPRLGERFASLDEIVEELQSVAREARETAVSDADALLNLAWRTSRAGIEFEWFAERLLEAREDDR